MNGKKILVTGATGFLGGYLIRHLIRVYPGSIISGISRSNISSSENFSHYKLDLLDQSATIDLVDMVKPDYVFHMAGLVFSYSWKDLYYGNIVATCNLLTALNKVDYRTQVVVAGSAAEYGAAVHKSLPITEQHSPLPQSPYGMTKLWQTQLSIYHQTKNVQVTVARIFNILGPCANRNLTTGDFFFQLLEIIQGRQEPIIKMANLKVRRDYIDTEDICGGLILLAKYGLAGEIYNVSSGYSVSYEEIVRLAIEKVQLNIEIVIDREKSKNQIILDIYGCNEKIRRATGWMPSISLEHSIDKSIGLVSDAALPVRVKNIQ